MTPTTESAKTMELLPCPDGHPDAKVVRDYLYHVECQHQNCHWSMRNFIRSESAIAAWNTSARSESAPVPPDLYRVIYDAIEGFVGDSDWGIADMAHVICRAIKEAPAPPGAGVGEPFDFVAHLIRQRTWSRNTFGPGERRKGVCDHIRKELEEIDVSGDLSEWIDVVILALDGAWRSGAGPEEIIDAIVAKQTKNEGRTWPDWRTQPPDHAIEHDRTKDTPSPSAERAPVAWVPLAKLLREVAAYAPKTAMYDDRFTVHQIVAVALKAYSAPPPDAGTAAPVVTDEEK